MPAGSLWTFTWFTAEENSAFIDYLQPNAEQIESGGKRPSIFTNACAINYKANSLFESRLNNTIIHNIQVTGQKQTLPLPWTDGIRAQKGIECFPQNKCRKWNQYTLPSCSKNVAHCKPYHPHTLVVVSKSKQNWNRIKPIFILPFLSAQGQQQRLHSKCGNDVFYWTGINCCRCNHILC